MKEFQISSYLNKFCVLCLMCWVTCAWSISLSDITPEQLAQFEAMPTAAKQALAKQMGVDLDMLRGLALGSGMKNTQKRVGGEGVPIEQAIYIDHSFESMIQQYQSEESGLKRFGLELFDQQSSSFSAVDNVHIPPDYLLGTGDTLNVLMFGKENQNLTLEVDREGQISLPRLGSLDVAGLTFSEAKSQISEWINEQLIGTEAVISAGEIKTINVFMAGEAKIPGSYAVPGLISVTQMLFIAGGVSDIGSLRNIRIIRNGQIKASFDLYDLLLNGNAKSDIRLQAGDVLHIAPVSALVSIDGSVRRPAIYEVKKGETVKQLMAMAGGPLPKAYVQQLTIDRSNWRDAQPELLTINLLNSKHARLKLQDGDKITVPEKTNLSRNAIVVKGAVVREGAVAFRKGLRVSDILGDIKRDLHSNVDLRYSLVVSTDPRTLKIDVRSFELIDAISQPRSEKDPQLQAQDEILIFSTPQLTQKEAKEDSDFLALKTQGSSKNHNAAGLNRGTGISQGPEDEINTDQSPRLVQVASSSQIEQRSANIRPLGQNSSNSFKADDKKETEDVEIFSRTDMLKPIILKLRQQADEQNPVLVVSISGAVKEQGEYPVRRGDRVSSLIRAAGGFLDDAFLSDAELHRVVVNDAGYADTQIQNLELKDRLSNVEQDPVLESRDHIFVRKIPGWVPDRTVSIEGEVRFPGQYQIGPHETINDLLRRSGGLTKVGFAEGAIFTRESAREQQTDQLREYIDDIRRSYAVKSLTQERNDAQAAPIEKVIDLLMQQKPIGRLVINVPEILSGNQANNLTLQNGDRIEIPRKTNTVSVIGEVRRPGVFGFESALNLKGYLELGAGFSSRANAKAIYIVHADGSVSNRTKRSLFSFNRPHSNVRPGDTIVVPVNTEYRDTLSFWSLVTAIASQSGLALASLATIANSK